MKYKVIFSIILSIISFNGCARVITDVSKEPKYVSLIGKEFVTRKDFVILKMQGGHYLLADLPGSQGVPEIKDISNNLPYKYEGEMIHGVLLKGAVLILIKIMNNKGFEYSNYDFVCKVISEGTFYNREINMFVAFKDVYEIPKPDPEYISEVKKVNK